MIWQAKAAVMATCANLPRGDRIYKFIQKRFGRLKPDPFSRLLAQREMAQWLLNASRRIEGCTVLEVGTGHLPVVPIGFFLSGAGRVITVDLNQRLDVNLCRQMLHRIAESEERLSQLYAACISRRKLAERLKLVRRYRDRPREFLKQAGIEYWAPADASATRLPAQSIDYHVSNTVLEHIPLADLEGIFAEAARILKPEGRAVHFVDLSDHFQHQDSRITKINFLKYSDKAWKTIAGNEYAYTNRLRFPEYLQMLSAFGFKVDNSERSVDPSSEKSIKDGFRVAEKFARYDREELCTHQLKFLLQPPR